MATATSPWWLLLAGRDQICLVVGLIYYLSHRIWPPRSSACWVSRFAATSYGGGVGPVQRPARRLVVGVPLPQRPWGVRFRALVAGTAPRPWRAGVLWGQAPSGCEVGPFSRWRIRLGWCWRCRGGAAGSGLFGLVLATSWWHGGRRLDDGALGMPRWCFSLCRAIFSGSVVVGDAAVAWPTTVPCTVVLSVSPRWWCLTAV